MAKANFVPYAYCDCTNLSMDGALRYANGDEKYSGTI